ncbi:MAG: hypothetical protein NTY20_01415 [Candidatus Aenigmarchaeota archaeon]|nr:hypothetical protein [Candidatus Aenigmarchaeota archaeon]
MEEEKRHKKTLTENIKIQDTVETYTKRLFSFITKYDERKVDECIAKGFYLEAIGTIFIQISEQLRFLLLKRIKGHENIPLDEGDPRYKKVLELIKKMKNFQINDYALIFNRINESEYKKLNRLRELRNDFSHSFDEREKYSELKIKRIINDAKMIERKLRHMVRQYPPPYDII